jgi:hypothetical protein
MRKEFLFNVDKHRILVVNTWIRGMKLYVDGDLRDHDSSFLPSGKAAMLSASLGDTGILEINPRSSLMSVELDAYLICENVKDHIFSSRQRLSLKQRRIAE